MKELIFLLFLPACTVIPSKPQPRIIQSFSGNNLNGGVISAIYSDEFHKTGFKGFLVTQSWVDEYNALVHDYGYLMEPAPKSIEGTLTITAEQTVIKRDLKDYILRGVSKEGIVSKVESKF